MQVVEGTWVVWVVWGMLLAGAGLIVASLWHTSERFWYWKQARQMAAGEVAPAAEALRIGQNFRILVGVDTAKLHSNSLSEEANEASFNFAASPCNGAITGQIIGLKRGFLTLLMEPETLTREDETARQRHCPIFVGQALTVQISGDSELFRFTAAARSVDPDPEQPFRTRVVVKLPFWLARIQRRKYVRVSLQAPITLQSTADRRSW